MNELLELIKKGSSISTVELAEKTGTTVEMVMARLERYEALHIIKKISFTIDGCSSGCGCGSSGHSITGCNKKHCMGCSHNPANKTPVVFWELV